MIKFYCPHCNQKLGVPDEYANRRVRCSKCSQPSLVPQSPTAPQSVGLEVLDDAPPPRQTAAQRAAPVPRHSAPVEPGQSGGFSDNLDIGSIQGSSNLEALAAVRAARNKQQRSTMRKSAPRAARSAGEGSGRLSGLAIGAGKIPLSIGASLAFGIGVCVLWTIVARLTGFIFVYFAVGVAAAAAYGLVVLTEHRNAGLGIAAIFIGLFCIVIGKFMIAKWVIMASPEYQEFQTEMDTGLDQALDSVPFSQMPPEEQAELLNDPMIIYDMGVMELWEQGQLDETVSRDLIFASVMMDPAQEEAVAPEGLENEHQAVMDHVGLWEDAQKRTALDTYYVRYLEQSQDWIVNSDFARGIGFFVAFICAFSLWDLIILPISGITAYKIASGGS